MNIVVLEFSEITEEQIDKIKHFTKNIPDLFLLETHSIDSDFKLLLKHSFNICKDFNDYWNMDAGYTNIRGIIGHEDFVDTEDYIKAKKNKIPIRII